MTDFDVGTLQGVNNTITGLQAQMDELEKQVREKGKALFWAEIKPLIDKYPNVGSINWAAYTPYFNDGDECTFSSHHVYPSFSSVKDIKDGTEGGPYEDPGEDWYEKSREVLSRQEPNPNYNPNEYRRSYQERDPLKMRQYNWVEDPNPDYDPAYGEAEKEITAFLKQFNDNTMRALFGDHVVVTVTREGVDTEHHEHE